MGENLNEWIKRMLQEKGWSMRELGRRSGLSGSFISRVLDQKNEPGDKFYRGIAKAFDLTADAVERLDRDGVQPESIDDAPITLREAWEIMSKLNLRQQWELLRYARYLSTLSDGDADSFVFDGEVGDDEDQIGDEGKPTE